MADNTEKTSAEKSEKTGAEKSEKTGAAKSGVESAEKTGAAKSENKDGENAEKTEKKDGLITRPVRNAIKKMAEISKCAEALNLMPTPEEFALLLIQSLRRIIKKVDSVQSRIYGLLDRYASIPTEFLLQGFDEVLEQLRNVSDTAKFAIKETTSILSNTTKGVRDSTTAVGDAVSATTSAVMQVGGGISYAAAAMSADLNLSMQGNNQRYIKDDYVSEDLVQAVLNGEMTIEEMDKELKDRYNEAYRESGTAAVDSKREQLEETIKNTTQSIDDAFDNIGSGLDSALGWIDGAANTANKAVDDTVGKAIEKVENAKRKVEEAIARVKAIIDQFLGDFEEMFGALKNGDNAVEDTLGHISDTAKEMNSPVFNEIAGLTDDVTKFIKNFNIGKIITGLGGLFVGAGAAVLAMDLLPKVDVDKMLKDVIGGINKSYEKKKSKMEELERSKNSDKGIELTKVGDFPWQLSKDDLEKYNAKGYNAFLEKYGHLQDIKRTRLLMQQQRHMSLPSIENPDPQKLEERANLEILVKRHNKYADIAIDNILEAESKSALKELRKVRRAAIKARQIEKYMGFLNTELDYLKQEFYDVKTSIKNDWDTMMNQYTTALAEVKKFFTKDGYGGNDKIDKACNRINEDAEKILELCENLPIILTSTATNVAVPYSIGTCVDMPVHKVVEFFKDIKIIFTFVKDLIRLGIDIISQVSVLVGIIVSGVKNIALIMKKLKELIGIDAILKMIDFIVALFKQKSMDAKILLENSISPIYYNETEEYEQKAEAIEALLDDDMDGGVVETFKYSDDVNAKKKHKKEFGGKLSTDDDIEEALDEFEAKGDREIVAYRSPILNAAGDDFAGWIFYHAYAYDHMKRNWSSGKKRRRNKLIRKASKKNKMRGSKLVGGVAQLKKNKSFGKYEKRSFTFFNGTTIEYDSYVRNSVTGYEAYYWYTKWTNDPTDCEIDMKNEGEDVVVPVQTTSNGSLVELSDGRRVFVEGKVVKSGDYVNVDGVKYRVK